LQLTLIDGQGASYVLPPSQVRNLVERLPTSNSEVDLGNVANDAVFDLSGKGAYKLSLDYVGLTLFRDKRDNRNVFLFREHLNGLEADLCGLLRSGMVVLRPSKSTQQAFGSSTRFAKQPTPRWKPL
jgi:hypothetical protein